MKLKDFLEQIKLMEINFVSNGIKHQSIVGENKDRFKEYIFEIYNQEKLDKIVFVDLKKVPEEVLNMNFIKIQIFCEGGSFDTSKYKILVSK
jgi:hypothetical protein